MNTLPQNHHQHNPEYITEILGMNGCSDLHKLSMNGKPYDMLLRKIPFDENNNRRSKTNKQGTWNDKAIVFKLKRNASYQTLEDQILDFVKSVKSYMLNKNVRSIMLDAMHSGMNSKTLVNSLEKEDADYWKMIKAVDPVLHKLQSLDEILCDEGIQCLVRAVFSTELDQQFDDLDNDIKLAVYNSGDFPADLECMFTEN